MYTYHYESYTCGCVFQPAGNAVWKRIQVTGPLYLVRIKLRSCTPCFHQGIAPEFPGPQPYPNGRPLRQVTFEALPERSMATDQHQDLQPAPEEPATTVQKLIATHARAGGTTATIEVHQDRVEYHHDHLHSATVTFDGQDPDDLYAVPWTLANHRVPDSITVTLIDHHPAEQDATSPQTHVLPTFSQDDALPPKQTNSGRFNVHLKKPGSIHPALTVLDTDGTVAHQDYTDHLSIKSVPKDSDPSSTLHEVTRHDHRVLAHPTQNNTDVNAPTKTDLAEIDQAASQLLNQLLTQNENAAEVRTWPTDSARRKLHQAGLPTPTPPATCRPYAPWHTPVPEVMCHQGATICQLPHTSAPALTRALASHPNPQRRYLLVNQVENPDRELPFITLHAVSASRQDGSTLILQVPRYSQELQAPMTHEPRLKETILETVRSITATIMYNHPRGDDFIFDLQTDLYADTDGRNAVILATPELNTGTEEFEKLTSIRHMLLMPRHVADDWAVSYHTATLTGQDPSEATRNTLQDIANAAQQVGFPNPGQPITATSKDGAITITLTLNPV